MQIFPAPAGGHPVHPASDASPPWHIAVVSTSAESTAAALREAATLAEGLGARITLLVFQVVPFPVPLADPPAIVEINQRRFRQMASECPVETAMHVYLCRDRVETLLSRLTPGSLVFIGGRRRWWPTAERSLARQLRNAGWDVILTEH